MVLVLLVAREAFETIVLPRTLIKRFRFTTLYFAGFWRVAHWVKPIFRSGERLENALGVVGPLSLILVIIVWSLLMIVGFALVGFGFQVPMSAGGLSFPNYLYEAATTFFTLGYGDVTPTTGEGRVISMICAGTGFGMLALVISYVPVLYQAFSVRERVSLLFDARAGSPPTAQALLATYGDDSEGLREFLVEIERWAATLLESCLSYPVLATYRSQHEKLSWMAVATCATDACALIEVAYEAETESQRRLHRQAKLTYAMCRHLVVDVAYVTNFGPTRPREDRMSPARWAEFTLTLAEAGAPVCPTEMNCTRLRELRADYEPYYQGLADGLILALPDWMELKNLNNAGWQVTAWDTEEHFAGPSRPYL
jgi:hypothetical protein